MSDRDRRTPKTPPHGIAAQLAPEKYPAGEDFSGDTGNGPAFPSADEDTPVNLPAVESALQEAQAEQRLRARVKDIKHTTEATHVGIDTLRFETKKDIARLENRITIVASEVTGQMATVKAHVEGVRAELVANTAITKIVADQLPVLQKTVLDALSTDRKLVREEDHWRTKQTLEVKTHEAKVAADDRVAKRKWWREISLKALSGGVALLTSGAIVGWIVTHLAC